MPARSGSLRRRGSDSIPHRGRPWHRVDVPDFLVMLTLTWGKIRTGRSLNDPVLRSEGKVTLTDADLAGTVLAAPVLNALLGWWWADPLAGGVIIYYAAREAVYGLIFNT